MKRALVLLILVGAAAGGAYVFVRLRANGQAQAEVAPNIAVVERGAIRLSVSSTGVVESNLDVEIKCKASGEIISLPYDVSDPVDQGALLVELDPVDEQRNVRQAEVELASSKAQLAQAQKNIETAELDVVNSRRLAEAEVRSAEVNAADKQEKAARTKALLEKKYASPEELETARTAAAAAAAALDTARLKLQQVAVDEMALEVKRQDVTLAQCRVDSDTISLENAKQRLEYTKVYAPMAGVVSERLVQAGQIISSPTNNVGGGTALLMLSDLSRVFVVASVDESDVGRVAVGQSVDITVDAFPDLHLEGSVVRIATMGTSTSNVVTFDVKVEVLSEAKSKLHPKMTANVDILVADRPDVLLLPSEGVQRRGPQRFVLLPAPPGQEPEHRPVEVGVDDGVRVEIVSGLEEGAPVLIPVGSASNRWTQQSERNGPSPEMIRRGVMMQGLGGSGRPGPPM
ncbi:MAG TPA: efflux RND transporter periplasmic adaptor subunit [Candidatus Hydrogenedentes bacterium]|nr:efflux RND transporter periplasmic adaptor subunit [Candidatus Hydrogenedentota bacterium]HPG69192.1 efflux RND transporter periplasmic adaptor subunit [Candidatus Hydrogenedentota bacterium]